MYILKNITVVITLYILSGGTMSIEQDLMERLQEAVDKENGCKRLAAQRLGIPEPTLSNWLSGRRQPMSDILITAINAMGLFFMTSHEMNASNRDCLEAGKEIALEEKAQCKVTAITSTERQLEEKLEDMKSKLSQKDLELMEAKTTVKNLKEQVAMLYNLLSGSKVSFVCNNTGDGDSKQIHN